MPLNFKDHKLGFSLGGILLGALVVAAIAVFFTIKGLEATVSTQKNTIDALRVDNATCETSKIGLKGEIESQNRAIQEAAAITERMQDRQREARAEADQARERYQARIAEIRREYAADQTCEQVRKKLISEATGHVFE